MLLLACLLSVLAVVYICYHADTYNENFLRHKASQLTREELAQAVQHMKELGGNWQVFYAELLCRDNRENISG